MSVFIVIPVHNRRELTRACLHSLAKQNFQDFKIVVIDDGSTDGTPQMLQEEFPDVHLLYGDGNLWWTGAINKGIQFVLDRCTESDFILVLNNDVTVFPEYISNLLHTANMFNHNALVGSVVVNKNFRILHGGTKINWVTAKWHNLNQGQFLPNFSEEYIVEVSTLTGRGTLIPVRVFREIGFYNDKHYLQCGDTELPVRARKAGYKLLVSYSAIVVDNEKEGTYINKSKKYRFIDLPAYLLDIKSNQNLRYRFWFAFDTADNLIIGSVYFAFDLARISWHFCRHCSLADA